ncbi:DUF5681 domain-containing protein [Bradyrhizobium cytisi]|uniref:DUF5681 domain-containing protein n=1 Tax=Bradyrhizobium cytisi TaxID=515489 RepID=A0A5S4WYM9_9BRAD|nr:DUF5681 domain-containing protein [Bradyrhizobium cytisi]TYL82229.1 hypothetical protein FXB38_21970 [Bradyrhizobium cytisi]
MNSQTSDRAFPAADTRFKPGQSGNPKGRPKKTAKEFDPGRSLQAVDNELISVTIDGKVVWMTKIEIHIRQLFTGAIKGEIAAAKAIFMMAVDCSAPDAVGPQQIQFKPALKASNPGTMN